MKSEKEIEIRLKTIKTRLEKFYKGTPNEKIWTAVKDELEWVLEKES